MVDQNWKQAVAAYLTRLEGAVEALAQALDDFELCIAAGNFNALAQPAEATAAASAELESLLDARSELLKAGSPDGPRGRSLRGLLKQHQEPEMLAICERVSERIEEQRVRTISNFVTHFHLAETSKVLVRVLTRSAADPGTYGAKPRSTGGGLLDEAA